MSRLGAVASWIDRRRWHGDGRTTACCGLDHHRGVWLAGDRIATEHMRPEPLGPGMHRRVLRRALAEQRPRDLAQAAVAGDVPRGKVLDHRQRVDLARQDVARQDPAAMPAGMAGGQREDGLLLDQLLLTVLVAYQPDQLAPYPAAAQAQGPWHRGQHAPAGKVRRPSLSRTT